MPIRGVLRKKAKYRCNIFTSQAIKYEMRLRSHRKKKKGNNKQKKNSRGRRKYSQISRTQMKSVEGKKIKKQLLSSPFHHTTAVERGEVGNRVAK